MKKHFFQFLPILFVFVYHLSSAQTHEILFKTGQAFKTTNREPLDSRLSNSKSGRSGFGFEPGYGYYFQSDYYVRLGGSYSVTSYYNRSSNDGGIFHREIRYNGKSESYGAYAEFGKRLHYKFIDFLAGIDAGFYKSPSHREEEHMYYAQQNPDYPGQVLNTESHSTTTFPGTTGLNLCLNTALYVKLYKPLYLGVEVSNGLTYSKQKGDRVTETSQMYSNGASYGGAILTYVEETQVGLQFFRTQLGIRYFFGTKNTAPIPGQAP
jgi:hypothetical protein